MAVPDFQSMMLPLLQVLADRNEYTFREVADMLVSGFRLTDDDLREMLPSGRQTKFTNRSSWARIYLKEAGLVAISERKTLSITQEGTEVLSNPPNRIDIKFLGRFPKFVEFRQRGRGSERVQDAEEVTEHTPQEILETSYKKLRDTLAQQLLSKIKDSTDRFFEELVLDLLVAMGYGGS
ncbi:MAG: restriction endonuclease, partial [Anaerolineae bacterium]|nr:restriction endonuclease [Anaerolineae bacterium]